MLEDILTDIAMEAIELMDLTVILTIEDIMEDITDTLTEPQDMSVLAE